MKRQATRAATWCHSHSVRSTTTLSHSFLNQAFASSSSRSFASATQRAIRVASHGGPEVLEYKTIEVAEPKSSEVLVRNAAIGVNFIDTYLREGQYASQTPFTPGLEGAGEVVAVGDGVKSIKVGDRVSYMLGVPTMNAYAEYSVVPMSRAVQIPRELTFEQAAAVMLQGMTGHMLVKDCYPVKKGDVVLVHAAAGGMGLILCQLNKALGATVIGTTSSDAKAKLALAAGAHHVINYTTQDFVEEVKKITNQKKVNVVYDGVGKATFLKGLDCLKSRGYMVLYGAASGQPDPIQPALLNTKGSLFLTRASLFHYTETEEEYRSRAADVLDWVKQGVLTPHIHQPIFALKDASLAHQALQGRHTTGKVLLKP